MATAADTGRSDDSVLSRGTPGLLDRLPLPLVLVDREGRIRLCNRPFAEATGQDHERLEGSFLWEFLSGDRLPEVRRHLANGSNGATDPAWNLLLHDGRGGCQLHSWTFRALEGDGFDGLTLGTGLATNGRTGASRDPEERLRRALITHSSDVLCVLSQDGALLFASPSTERVLGYRPDELVGTSALELIDDGDVPAVRAAIERASASPGRSETVELKIRAKDDHAVVMEARGVVHVDGSSIHVLVNLSDVTERTRAEAALAESEERFRSAFENTTIGKVLWDADGQVRRVNRAVCAMLGYSREDLLQMSWRDLCHPEDRESFLPSLRPVLAGEAPSVQASLRVRHLDGQWIWVRATLTGVRRAADAPADVIGELEDITAERSVEAETRARQERRQAHQSAIVAIAVHEAVANGPLEAALTAITELAAKATGAARTSVWFLEEDGEVLRCADLFVAAEASHSSGEAISSSSYPAYFNALQSDRVIDADDARSDPRTVELTRDYLEPLGITSMLDAPIRIRGEIRGVVCLEHVGEPRVWHPEEVDLAAEVADQVAHSVSNSQRSITESRLHASEERFRTIVNAIPMGLLMYRLTADGRLIFCGANPAADRILGVSCQRYLGKTIEEAFPPLAETEIPARYRAAAEGGVPWHTEQVIYRDELIEGAYEVHAFQTTPGTVAVVFLDITERRRAEETLRESEARYRSLFERNLAGVYRSTVDGVITQCNDAMAAILGCSSAADAMRRPAAEFYPSPEDRRLLLEALEEAGELRNLELELRRVDGASVWVLANMSLERDGDGKAAFLDGTMVDISELKHAADRLLLQSTALESAANAIAVTTPDGIVSWVNPAFTDLTGYSADEAIGQSLWKLKSGTSDAPLRDDISAALDQGQVWHGELVNRRQDGRLYTEELTITPVRGAEGDEIQRLIAVQQDVSERKRIEEQLQQAQKMEAVGRLAGGVAHDFNNLLQAMLGEMAMLRQRHGADELTATRLHELEEYVRRGSQLTRQLLLFSRRDTPRRERLDLNDVVHGTVRLLHRLLRENIELVFAPADIDLPLVADRGQIEQVVMNLAVNACDAMPRGGRLFLQTGRESDRAWLEVVDSGEGIPDDIRGQLFEPFFTTKEPGKGTGLGLSVVHSIVTRLDGTIDLDSRVGEGTSIRISLPMTAGDEQPTQPAPKPEPAEPATTPGQRILVVEDDPAVRSGLRELLGMLGYEVTSVGSREETIFLPPAPAFDLLLTDFVLPDGSGTEIAHELRARWPGLRVIVMSGYAQDVPLDQDSKLEGMDFLQKPFGSDTLASAVRSVLGEPASDPRPAG